MLGAPASGKGKYCEAICAEYNVPHISTSDLLRTAITSGSDLGKAAKSYMDRGEIVADEVMLPIVIQHLSSEKLQASGWLLDGWPRTQAQAEALRNAKLQPQVMLWLDVGREALIGRVEQRRFDPVAGQIYYMQQCPPTESEVGAMLCVCVCVCVVWVLFVLCLPACLPACLSVCCLPAYLPACACSNKLYSGRSVA